MLTKGTEKGRAEGIPLISFKRCVVIVLDQDAYG